LCHRGLSVDEAWGVHAALGHVRDEVDDTIDAVNRASGEPRALANGETTDDVALATVERRHYAIRGEIASGGMGRVLEARDLRLGRAVAIKELLPKHRDAARRFEREARITARLQHPAIINVYEAGVWPGGEPFYAMTKVTGRSLGHVVDERRTLEERLGLLPHVIAVADALAYAHSQDVIHRDLKPGNVLVGEFGETVVIDWGLAKDLAAPADPAMSLEMRAKPVEQTLSGSVVGTPAYMPPEQARGESVDHRADVYSLGALLYKVLVGAAPYEAASSDDVVQQVLDGPPVPVDEREPGAPADLVAIVTKAMARGPDKRYPTAAELAADLKRFQTGQLVAAHHYTRRQLAVRWFQRHRLVVAITAIALATFAVFGTIGVRRIISEKDRAEREQRKDERRREALLEERGRAELLAGRAGPALANLAGAVHGKPSGALGFLIAEAMRPFEAQLASVKAGEGTVLVSYHPDGTELATATTDGVVATWDAAGKPIREIARLRGQIRALAWSADGKMLAAGGDDRVVHVWSADGAVLRELAGHTDAIGDLSFSPDGTRLVTASADGTARMWDLETRSSGVIATYDSAVTVAQFSPEGMRVITGSEDGAADVWGETTVPDSPLRAHTNTIKVARWSPLGTHPSSREEDGPGGLVVTTSADGTARIWNPASGKVIAAPIRHKADVSIEDAVWSHDGTRLITAGSDHVARLWLVPEPPGEGEIPAAARELAELAHSDRVIQVRFSADDRWIVTAGNDRYARVWDAKGQPVAMFEHAEGVASVELSRDGTPVATGCRDGTAHIWDLQRGISRASRELASPIHAIAVARDGRIAAGTDSSRVWIWRADGTAQVLRKHLGRVLAVAFSDGGDLVTGGEDASVYVWAPGADQPRLALPTSEDAITTLATSASMIAAGDEAGTLWLWSQDGKLVAKHSVGTPIVALAAHGDAVVVGTKRGVEVWTANGRTSQLATSSGARGLAFDARGELLAVAGVRDATVARFAANTVTPLLQLEGPTGDVAAIVFSADGSLVFTGGADGVARVWDAAKGKLLANRETGGEAIEALALSSDELLWTANTDGVARALDVHVLRDPTGLRNFMERHVPWRLGDDDIVRRR
jgi:WD40 repeat protein/tRNA A-37 threonylcarbamoyl transferase component Bud32